MGPPPMTIIKPELTEDDDKEQHGDKTEPRTPDDDGGDEVDAEFIPDDDKPLCTWSDNKDEHRRVFVFDRLNNSDIAGQTLVENMHVVCNWLKDGVVPKQERKLKSVNKE